MDYFEKYLKYKTKYLELKSIQKNLEGGGKNIKLNNQQISRMNLEPKYVETLSEPWFTLICLGLKTVEGRKNK